MCTKPQELRESNEGIHRTREAWVAAINWTASGGKESAQKVTGEANNLRSVQRKGGFLILKNGKHLDIKSSSCDFPMKRETLLVAGKSKVTARLLVTYFYCYTHSGVQWAAEAAKQTSKQPCISKAQKRYCSCSIVSSTESYFKHT